jgi:UDP-GlcNAc:undecaprenyl-phosphate GlcNAc-1-phosphate transferase
MLDVAMSLLIAFGVTFFAIPAIINVAEQKKLFDIPDERKIHQAPIPSLGGIGIFAGFIISVLFSLNFTNNSEFPYFLAAAVVIFFLGLKDDILIISPVKKFIGQVLASFLIIYKGGVQIHSMHGFLGMEQLPEVASLLLTYFTILVIINSFNLIDGVDGLAGSLAVLASTTLGFFFFKISQPGYAMISFALSGATIAFLIYNYQPAKIFMGDTGSMLIGLINAILVIQFINFSSNNNMMPLAAGAAIGFSVLFIPLLDTLRVFAIRIFCRRSPFSADRNHIHHLLLDLGFSHRNITLMLIGFNILVILLNYGLRQYGTTSLILGTVALFFMTIAIIYFPLRSKRAAILATDNHADGISQPTLVGFSNKPLVDQKN